MATPIVLGAGVIAAAVVGRHIARNGLRFGKHVGEEFVKGGFKAKMDRREALDILGLRYACYTIYLHVSVADRRPLGSAGTRMYAKLCGMPTAKSCSQTTRTEEDHLTSRVKLTKHATCSTSWRKNEHGLAQPRHLAPRTVLR